MSSTYSSGRPTPKLTREIAFSKRIISIPILFNMEDALGPSGFYYQQHSPQSCDHLSFSSGLKTYHPNPRYFLWLGSYHTILLMRTTWDGTETRPGGDLRFFKSTSYRRVHNFSQSLFKDAFNVLTERSIQFTDICWYGYFWMVTLSDGNTGLKQVLSCSPRKFISTKFHQ